MQPLKKVVVDGKEYLIRTLPLEYAPEVFEVVKKMFLVADKVVNESADMVPEDMNQKLKLFMAIVDYTQEKLREAKFFREHAEPLDISSGGTGTPTPRKTVKTSKAKGK